jgi:MoaA/NifB/PqqE/SkfB family radical SAM enzyme
MKLISLFDSAKKNIDYALNSESFKLANNRLSPDYVELIVNKSCFFKCKMCNIWNLKEPEVLQLRDVDYFLWSLRKIVKLPYTVFICGGETLTYKYLEPLIRKCSQYGFGTVITTNGFLLSDKLVRKLTMAGLKDWVISLDSIDLEVHDRIRGIPGSGKKILEGISLIKSINPKAQVNINTVIMGDNLPTLLDTLDWALANPEVGMIHFNAVTEPIGAVFDSDWKIMPKYIGVWPEDFSAVDAFIDGCIERIKKGAKLTNSEKQLEMFRRYFYDPESFVIPGACHMNKTISVDADGSIHMCHYYGKIGNIKDRKFIRAWTGEKAKGVRKKIGVCRKNCKMLINCNYKE